MRDIAKSNGIMADNVVAYPFTIKNMTKLSKMFMSDKEYEEYKNSNNVFYLLAATFSMLG